MQITHALQQAILQKLRIYELIKITWRRVIELESRTDVEPARKHKRKNHERRRRNGIQFCFQFVLVKAFSEIVNPVFELPLLPAV